MVASSFWRFQPTLAGNVKVGTLQPTPGQVGAGATLAPHMVTNEAGGFPTYAPEIANQPASVHTWRPKTIGYNDAYRTFLVDAPATELLPTTRVAQGNTDSGHSYTGAPDVSAGDFAEHGPLPAPIADLYGGQPTAKDWKTRLKAVFKQHDLRHGHKESQLPGMGTDDAETREIIVTDAGVSALNAFQIVDPRRTFDTPNLPGLHPGRDGKVHVGKAGRPTEDECFDPMHVQITNSRVPVDNDSLPFLSDRVRAGAAEPGGARPANVPHWYTLRPFDQDIAWNLTGQKGVVNAHIAARPLQTTNERQVDMSALGAKGGQRRSSAPGMTPAGPMPSTVRGIPQPWDADLYNAESNNGFSTARAKSWRL